MSQGTGIQWADDSMNPWWGCQRMSPACDHCYAAGMAVRFSPQAAPWDGTIVRTPRTKIEKHLHALEQARTARRVFVGSMTDVGLVAQKDPDSLAAILSDLYRVQWARAHRKPQAFPLHAFILLTKRPATLRRFLGNLHFEEDTQTFRHRTRASQPGPFTGIFPGLWVGVTAENQEQASKRIPELLKMPLADKRIVSVEPMLGPVTLTAIKDVYHSLNALTGARSIGPHGAEGAGSSLDQVIVGGETGGYHKSRPMHPAWVNKIQAECQAHAVPFFFKSWGDWKPIPLDNGRRDETMGAWLGEAPHQWTRLRATPPDGYQLMSAKTTPTEHLDPGGERPQETPPFPEPHAL